jgi:hypothetical protein
MTAFALLTLAVLAAAPSDTRQDADAESYLEAGVGRFNAGDYERALALTRKARDLGPSRTLDARCALWEGVLLGYLLQPDEGKQALREAFNLDPCVELQVRISPKVQSLVDEARRARKRACLPAAAVEEEAAGVAPAAAGVPVVPLLAGAVALGAAGTGTYFGVNANSHVEAARAAQFQDERVVALERASRDAGAANVALAVAAGAAVTALVTWLLSR